MEILSGFISKISTFSLTRHHSLKRFHFFSPLVIASLMLVPGQVLGLYLPIFESCQSKGKGKAPYITLHHIHTLFFSLSLRQSQNKDKIKTTQRPNKDKTKTKQRQNKDKDNLTCSIQAAHLLVLAKAKWFEAQKREGKVVMNKEGSSSL